MEISIGRSMVKNQMYLAYDCLIPEEAGKLIDCFYSDVLCELLKFCEVNLAFNCSDKIDGKFSKDLVLFIETPEFNKKNVPAEEVEKQMDEDKVFLETVAKKIKTLLDA